MIYIEMERADARTARNLVAELERTLAQVRDAVRRLARAAERRSAPMPPRWARSEGTKLLRWFHDGAMTLAGARDLAHRRHPSRPARHRRYELDTPILAEASRKAAVELFQARAARRRCCSSPIRSRRSIAACRSTSSSCRSPPAAT
jgi:glutamate dehydrogenase